MGAVLDMIFPRLLASRHRARRIVSTMASRGSFGQEVEDGSGECYRITTGPIMVDILKNDLLSPGTHLVIASPVNA
jgi:hypothetical protein